MIDVAIEKSKTVMASHVSKAFQKVYCTEENPCIYFAPISAYVIGSRCRLVGHPVLMMNMHFGYYLGVRSNDKKLFRIGFLGKGGAIVVDADGRLPYRGFEKGMEGTWMMQKIEQIEKVLKDILRMRQDSWGLDVLVHLHGKNGMPVSNEQILCCILFYLMGVYGGYLLEEEKKKVGTVLEWMKRCDLWRGGYVELCCLLEGEKNCFVLSDRKKTRGRNVAIEMKGYELLLFYTGVTEGEAEKRRERYQVCEKAMRKVQTYYPLILKVSDMSMEEYLDVVWMLDSKERQYLLHFVTENKLIEESVFAMENGDLFGLGVSLFSGDYSYSNHLGMDNEKRDYIVEFSKKYGGILGAIRLRYEWDGMVLVIVSRVVVEDYLYAIKQTYEKRFGYGMQGDGGKTDGDGDGLMYTKVVLEGGLQRCL